MTPASRGLRALAICIAAVVSVARAAPDPLPSWNDGAAKQRILAFVQAVTDPASNDHVPAGERIATFDNDGTLWAEKPMYFQVLFALAGGERAIAQIAMATHAGMTTAEFEQIVREWMATARHPTTGRLLTGMVYQPMLELLAYLRASGFKTFIVSGGGIEFMRPWSERVYGVPPEQVIGSSIKTRLEERGGVPVLVRLPELNFIDDGPGKPVGINEHIGRRPVAAFGNSDGDLQMLQWTAAGGGRRLCLLVHHTDAEREWAYDRPSDVGRLDKALDLANAQGWMVVDMKQDWKVVFPGAPARGSGG